MPEGEHEVTTELGNYLVDNGHAVYVDSAPVDVDLDTLQAEGEATVTHDDGSTSAVSIADDEPAIDSTIASGEKFISSTPKAKHRK